MAEQDDTRLGNVLTPEEYQSRFIDYYNFPGIGVEAAPEVDDEEKEDEPVRPNILTPVGQRDEQVANVFGQIPVVGTGQQISTEDPYEYIRAFDAQEKSDLNGKGFSRYLEQAAGVPGAVTTVATGLPIGALAYGASGLVRKQHRKNAESIASYGGNAGSMFKFQGQTVSRAPGSKIFTGNLGGLSQSDMYRVDEIRKGFIPGTMVENMSIRRGAGPQGMPGSSGLSGVTSIEGAIMDAFGTIHTGQRNDSGHMMASASQAQALREKEFRSMARQAEVDISGLKGVNFVNAAVAYKQHVDGVMKTDSSYGGFFHKTSNLSPGQNASALDRRRGTAVDFLKDKYGITTTPTVTDSGSPSIPSGEAQGQGGGQGGASQSPPSGGSDDNQPPPSTGRQDRDESDGGYSPSGTGGGRTDYQGAGGGRGSGYGSAGRTTDRAPADGYSGIGGGFAGARAAGGRVGMQAGGAAQRPLPEAGFVAGPPENFTERETVADDQNGSVAEGTFVINAAAVEFAGSDDIRKMILDAYSTAREKGLDIGRVDRKLYEGTVDVALSKGEVVVPPELAKIIGYDRLEKINNRGKKEVSRRQKKAGGGFLDGKKFADGGEVDLEYEDRIVTDEVRRKMKALVASLPNDVEVESVYYQPGYPAAQRYQDELARLNETLPITGVFFSDSKRPVRGTNKFKRTRNPKINVPQTPTLLNLAILAEEVAHQDALKHRELYDPKKHKVDRDTFNVEQDYLEELRAKDFALDVVGALFPKGEKTFRGTRASYEKEFAEYLAFSNDPKLVKTYLEKYPELKRFMKELPTEKNDPLLEKLYMVDDENYYGPGQPRVMPDSSFLDAALREDVVAMNEYHASFNYMLDKFKYLVTQIFIPDADKPFYVEGYTASKGK